MARHGRVACALRNLLESKEVLPWFVPTSRAARDVRGAHGDASVAPCSGVPDDVLDRKVKIYRPSRVATQQGSGNTNEWKIDFGQQDKWENPLMGWVSTGDPMASVGRATLTFDTKDAAMAFCKKYGWEYEVIEPNESSKKRPPRFQGYGDNFSVRRAGIPVLPGNKTDAGDGW